MKKIAVLSDIHANLPALEAVWRDLEALAPDEVYHLGDLVGYNPYPEEAVDFVRRRGLPGIRGNYDLAVAAKVPDPASAYLKEPISPNGWAAYRWSESHVPENDREYLLGLPERIDLEIEGHRLTLVHGSPDDVREYLYPDTPEERLAEAVASAGCDLLLCGHTHRPMIRKAGRGLVINPGSVGKPKDGDPRAGYLVLTLTPDGIEPEIRRVEYDLATVARTILATDLPEVMATSLQKGLSN